MASVFLSYDREDAVKARPIASSLEKVGHSVWWDRQIGGGSEFSREIERALDAADIVIVLWSQSSIESPWVRDEAGAGRDKGRLVPLSLEGTQPPLGFRQFHSIDLGRWRGRGRVPRLDDILAAIERRSKEPGIPAEAQAASQAARKGPLLNTWLMIGFIVGLLVVVLGLVISRPWESKSSGASVVAVTAADPSADGVAHDLLDELGKLTSARAGSVRLLAATSQERPDLAFKVSTVGADKGGANLVLTRGTNPDVLWSKEFTAAPTPASLNARVAYDAGRVLGCAVDGLQGKKALRAQTLKLYLSGCSEHATAAGDKLPTVVPMFEQVVKDAPDFEGGWAQLLLAETDAFGYLPELTSADRESLRLHISQARRLDPDMAEAAIAQVMLLPKNAYGETLRLLDKAHAASPDNATVLTWRTQALLRVGRLSEAIEDARRAAQLDPLSPDVLNNYVLALAYSGRLDAARTEFQHAQRLWAGTEKFHELEYAFKLRFENPKGLLETDEFRQAPPAWQMYVRTRIDPTPANVDRFMAFLRKLGARRGVHAGDIAGHSQAYGELHRENDLYQMVDRVPADEDLSPFSEAAFRPALRKFRQDPRFMLVAKRMDLLDYWQKSGKWPDFCFVDTDQPYDCKAEAAKLD